jgi:hypothetical protein
MKIESKKELVNQSIQIVFDFLKDTRNIYELLPQDKISDWKADELSCSFKVQEELSFLLCKLLWSLQQRFV